MATQAIVSFLLVSLVATATPGPATLYVLSGGISKGARGFLPAVLGILSADAVYFALSVAGLGTFLLASYGLFVAVKWAGAAYLIWLGLRMLASAAGRSQRESLEPTVTPTGSRWFSGGFTVHAANPKALLYFGSIVPQFLRSEDPLLPQVAALGVLHLVTAFMVMSAYGVFAARVRLLAHKPWFTRTLHGASGALLIAAGAGLASIKQKAG